MTYSITFLCVTGTVGPSQVLESVVRAVGQDGPRLALVDEVSGEAWAEGGIIAIDGVVDPSAIRLEVRGPSELTAEVILQYAEETEKGKLDYIDSVATLTISGEDIDWMIVREIWRSLVARWSAVPYDETSGFDTSIDALG